MRSRFRFSGIIILTMTLSAGCSILKPTPLRVAISSSSENYENWIKRTEPSAVLINFKGMEAGPAGSLLESCDGLLLTGGVDVEPALYGKTCDTSLCKTDPERDALEMALIRKAINLQIPVIGICRGQQILNVATGGTLFTHIPADCPSTVIHRSEDNANCLHQVKIDTASNLNKICQVSGGLVNSSHHQAVEVTSDVFKAVAWSDDGIIEAIEYVNPEGKPYLQAVQWHPERMDPSSPLSTTLMKSFITAMEESRKAKK
ncbi:MAG TPA: gamma-glutamyl-gamma-aminobutyrate hydrolase family protein [Bacteroidales bacterium]|nr:gamma-glutamyl-gamma-aminobutyrate hydrolase family protein [Bacteroidales bacterium]HPT01776.1 gamma-glutamyl-gamma-aminobutyrate hydrolase family protein [Bacteroidales bacterium]